MQHIINCNTYPGRNGEAFEGDDFFELVDGRPVFNESEVTSISVEDYLKIPEKDRMSKTLCTKNSRKKDKGTFYHSYKPRNSKRKVNG